MSVSRTLFLFPKKSRILGQKRLAKSSTTVLQKLSVSASASANPVYPLLPVGPDSILHDSYLPCIPQATSALCQALFSDK